MRSKAFWVVALPLFGIVVLPEKGSSGRAEAGPIRLPPASIARPAAALGQLPLYFVENRGQLDSRVAYYVQGRTAAAYFARDGVTFALTEPLPGPGGVPARRWALKLDFVDALPDVKVEATGKTSASVSYFKGPRQEWRTGIPTYGSVVYSEVWPGIDAVYSGTSSRLKYTFIVKPGADPRRIRLAYRGAAAVRLGEAGTLEVETPVGTLRDERPYSYQEAGGGRVEVPTAYRLEAKESGGTAAYGFEIGSYDSTKTLVLDPVMLLYAGYIGGSADDYGQDIAVDAAGNAYVTGYTASTESSFPVLVGPDLTHNGALDAFVAKVNAAGTSLLYAGYIGGSGADHGQGITVDAAGNAYVTGYTTSTEASFPVLLGPDLTHNGAYDAFVAKVNATGSGLLYAGYIGGAADDFSVRAVAVDASGSAYVGGFTESTEASFPVLVGPDLTHNGGRDVFVAKVNPAGTGLLYAGYIGGSGTEEGGDVAVDGAGEAYVTGSTTSPPPSFPVLVGPDLTHNGGFDAFVAKVNATGTTLLYSGYVGGSADDHGSDVYVDSAGNAYVAGDTASTEASFPEVVGPDLTHNGGVDAFVAKVNPTGSGLLYAGYIGGSGQDQGQGIAVDAAGAARVAGYTNSTEATFPVVAGPDLTWNGGFDAFAAEVDPTGATLVYCGYIGGAQDDFGIEVTVDAAGSAYVTGFTGSDESTFPATVGPDLTFNGVWDAFVAKVGEAVGPPDTVVLTPPTATNPVGTSHTVTATVTDEAGRPVAGVVVRFSVAGAHTLDGSCTTDGNGRCTFTYTGTQAGTDAIEAYADSDDDGEQDPGEPAGAATKVWTRPTQGCPPDGGDDDEDDDGLEDDDESLFGTLLGNRDSDGDGRRDGDDDSDDDGEDDEDEDDGTEDECPNDSDGDGEDDEDEDDEEDDDDD